MFGCTIAVCCLSLSRSCSVCLSHSCLHTLFSPLRHFCSHSLPIYAPFVRFQMHFLPQTVSNLSVLPPPLPSIHLPPPSLTCCLCGSLDLHWLPITVLVLAESQMPSRPLRKGCRVRGGGGRLEE